MRMSALMAVVLCVAACAGDAPKPGQPGEPKTIEQSDDGSIVLHGKHASIQGKIVRFEPQPHKNTLGYWTSKDDTVSWTFVVKTPGTFKLVILQGCGKDSGGAEVEMSIGEQKVKFVVEDTGGFQNFKEREIGEFKLEKAGEYTLLVKPLTKPGVAVMDLRQAVLAPKK